jgi:hypothetical protein
MHGVIKQPQDDDQRQCNANENIVGSHQTAPRALALLRSDWPLQTLSGILVFEEGFCVSPKLLQGGFGGFSRTLSRSDRHNALPKIIKCGKPPQHLPEGLMKNAVV